MSSKRRSMPFMYRFGIAVIFTIGMMIPLTASAHVATRDGNNAGIPNFQHVFVIMMENTGFDSLIGNSNAPFINSTAKSSGFAKSYFGVTHPSQPNYIAATSGSTNGVVNDSTITIDVPNIVDQLEAHGKTWKAYMQSIFAGGNTNKLADSAGNQLYERKHNPFVSYTDVQNSSSRMANVVDFSQFTTDLASNSVPNYAWISPDQCHDMHGRGGGGSSDPCDFSNLQLLIAAGDAFLKSTVKAIFNSQAWQNSNSAIFITWDESDFPFNDISGCCDANPGGGHVVTLVLLSENETARTSGVAYNHYSMLSTIEGAWKLGCLAFTCDTANVKPMTDLVNQNG